MPLNQITPLVGIPLSQIWGPLVLDGLQVDDLLEIAWNHFDEGVIREFVLATATRRRVRDGAPRPSEPTKLYSTVSMSI